MLIAAAQSASVPGDIDANIQTHLRFVEMAAERGVELLVFPELSLTGYELELARANVVRFEQLDVLRDAAARTGMFVVPGGPFKNERGELHIAAFVLKPDGSTAIYAKEHVHSSEQHVFTSGPGGELLAVGEVNVALAICADASQPSHAAAAAGRGAQVYAVGAFIDEAGYDRKSKLMAGYAREHGICVLFANYSGVTGGDRSAGRSCIWASDGRVLACVEDDRETLVVGDV